MPGEIVFTENNSTPGTVLRQVSSRVRRSGFWRHKRQAAGSLAGAAVVLRAAVIPGRSPLSGCWATATPWTP